MKAALYIRVSTVEQATEGFSIRAQNQRLLSYVDSQGWTLFDTYIDDGKSAKDTKRPQLQRMMEDIKHGKIDVVLVYRLDRLTRSVLDLYKILEYLESHNTKFKSATEVYDTTTATGRLFLTLVAALAQWERENLSERVQMGIERMVDEGKHRGGRLPYGYKYENKEIVIDEQAAEIVRKIFELYVNGKGITTISQQLNKDGHKRNGFEFEHSFIMRALTRRTYIGELTYKDKSNVGLHPPIIDEATFYQVQTIIESRKQKHPQQVASKFIFAGVLYCARCGNRMTGRNLRGRGPTYKMYQCNGRIKGLCDMSYLREDLIEDKFISELEKIIIRQKEIAERVMNEGDHSEKVSALYRELENVKERKKKWQLAFANDAISLEDLKERNEEDERKMMQIKRDIEDIETSLNVDDGSLLLEVKKNWHDLDIYQRKVNAQSIVNEMHVNAEKGRVGKGKDRHIWITDIDYK